MREQARDILVRLGLSGLEADIYVALLREPGATGYRVSQIVGKPVANTYKALDSMRVKGAVVVDESSGSRTYSPISVHEYIDGMRRNLEIRQEQIESELKDFAAAPMHGGIYELSSIQQVYERCRNLLQGAKSMALLDAHAAPLEVLRPDLEAATGRGIKVFIKTYSAISIAGCDIVAPPQGVTEEFWNGDWLNVIVDWREYVQSLLKKDGSGVWEALWSRNPYLAIQVSSGCLNELILTRVGNMIAGGSDLKTISTEMRRLVRLYERESPLGEVLPPQWITDKAKEAIRKTKRPVRAEPEHGRKAPRGKSHPEHEGQLVP